MVIVVSVKLRDIHQARLQASKHSITKHLGKRLALFQIETSNFLESYKSEAHNHFHFLSKHDNGKFPEMKMTRFGEKGRDVGQFEDAKDVTYVSRGRTLVTDLIDSRIQMCSVTGRPLMLIKGQEICEPWGITLTNDGNIAVTSVRNKCVQVLTESGDILHTFGADFFKHPSGIAVDKRGNFIVADSATNRVSFHNRRGSFLNYLGCSDDTDKSFSSPRYVCCSSAGDIIVSDSGNHCLKIFDSKGRLFKTFGTFGKGKVQFKFPYGVCTSSLGDIFVADHYNSRVSMFDNEGEFVCHVATSSLGLKHPQGIAMSPEFDLYVTHGHLKAYEILTFKLSSQDH